MTFSFSSEKRGTLTDEDIDIVQNIRIGQTSEVVVRFAGLYEFCIEVTDQNTENMLSCKRLMFEPERLINGFSCFINKVKNEKSIQSYGREPVTSANDPVNKIRACGPAKALPDDDMIIDLESLNWNQKVLCRQFSGAGIVKRPMTRFIERFRE
ncbi:hypothetical protein [Acetobacter oeni]|uniref:Uncharacterized protein n=1 Tax=Acetobacter oeni TaxID=304077 RepID=A0A511XIM7_9PROT|nr:hypothetical protein [Acetobacter oeni]MBB3881902.1 hypothetical protein [Acetobacter oeni]NHO17775.1 hypothetical protein [Acetobacter oeni]GBR02463.1 hypothetical protein AA21952_0753 [Acetobacter oeni LMG 21952]GEN62795.1 hypothetical protein AOE01nite_10190 [Acetobacter oeni]